MMEATILSLIKEIKLGVLFADNNKLESADRQIEKRFGISSP